MSTLSVLDLVPLHAFAPLSSSTILNALVQLLTPLTITLGTYTLYKVTKFVWTEYINNPLKELPGPPSPSWIYGSMQQIRDAENSVMHEQWIGEYGSTIKYKVFLGMSRLFTMDLKAINHILMNSQVYQKPEQSRFFLSRILGDGVLIVEGEKHRKQRKVMNPGFRASQIRELTEIFVEKALELRDVWSAEIKEAQGEEQTARINVLSGLSKMTLDVIGLAGFNYKFNALQGGKSELNEAFNAFFSARPQLLVGFLKSLMGRFGFLIPAEGDKASQKARAAMDRIGNQLLNESKAALEKTSEGRDERFKRRDLLSLLLKANMSTDLPQKQKMSNQDVLAQVPTFLVAGHETTSTGTTWALYALSLHPDVQSKLREELYAISTDNPSMDELNALPYLDAVVRETLRVHPPVPTTMRAAAKDDVIPVGMPFVDRKGRVRDSILVQKGQTLLIPILAINRATKIWGPDAREFKPERWESIPEGTSAVPGVWGNLLTFLGGPRACIGHRFSLVEMKALLFTLIRAFEFKLAVSPNEITQKTEIVQRPVLINDLKAGAQMPLLVTPYIHAL
ncbi:cytochrome P450 [Macrolepiota fuliginosa MF-IS2]|uniref:Cytochrome P450 n=1 Tax=Macrolepiota fuliginosa MF-IS2 TaxID=1400762 RepID=A0A9P5XNK7_9AGAR|nr:cytochrome P450 [Macrolepiota fuliginosa MF-IS2]